MIDFELGTFDIYIFIATNCPAQFIYLNLKISLPRFSVPSFETSRQYPDITLLYGLLGQSELAIL